MRLRLLRSSWGFAGLRSPHPRDAIASALAQGWHGFEASLGDIGATSAERRAVVEASHAEGATLVLSAYSSWPNYVGPFDARRSAAEHASALALELREIAELSSLPAGTPVARINAHSGSDIWCEAEAREFFEASDESVRALGDALPPVSHETHRGRYLCCPFATARMLSLVPSLRLTSDFSHWVVKCERLLDTVEEVELLNTVIAPAVDHVHARIGTPQASQVAAVSLPHAARAAERHYAWWEAVWSAQEARAFGSRDSALTATVEYGPVEIDAGGECVGYTPVRRDESSHSGVRDVEVGAGERFEATLDTARRELSERFESWHADATRRTPW